MEREEKKALRYKANEKIKDLAYKGFSIIIELKLIVDYSKVGSSV